MLRFFVVLTHYVGMCTIKFCVCWNASDLFLPSNHCLIGTIMIRYVVRRRFDFHNLKMFVSLDTRKYFLIGGGTYLLIIYLLWRYVSSYLPSLLILVIFISYYNFLDFVLSACSELNYSIGSGISQFKEITLEVVLSYSFNNKYFIYFSQKYRSKLFDKCLECNMW